MSNTQPHIYNYADFTAALLDAGFSMGGGNSEGIYAAVSWNWNQTPPYNTPVRWHTGNAETDPWEWRMRVLDDSDSIAYAKVFFKKSGYITRQWYPYFLAARHGTRPFEEAYAEGAISHAAKRIYQAVQAHGSLPVHGIKALAGFPREEKASFDRALTELQMNMHLTMCGRRQKRSAKGLEYGWSSTVFCTTRHFFGDEVFAQAAEITPQQAGDAITAQVLRLNPAAPPKKIAKFINGA